jgi:YggT family protein
VMALLAPVLLLKIGLYIVMVAIIVQVVLSWVNPHSPVMPVLNSLSRPFLRVFQRRIPPIGNVDLSPLFALVVIQLLLILPIAWLEITLPRLL